MFGCVVFFFFLNEILLCDEQNCVLLTGICIYLLTVAYFWFEIFNCVQKEKKINPNLPIVVILFVKPVMINILNGYQYSVLLVAHQPFWQVFLFINPNWISFCFIWWRCIFIPYFTVFFSVRFDKNNYEQPFFLDFFLFTCLWLLLLFLTSSFSLCHNALFIPNLHNKRYV